MSFEGAFGVPGPQGPKGDKGDPGDDGADGADGAQGPTGLPASAVDSIATDVVISTTSTWTQFHTFTATVTVPSNGRAAVTARMPGTTTSGTGVTCRWRIKHTAPDASIDYRGYNQGTGPSIFDTWSGLAAGSHTFTVEYYLTGSSSPAVSYRKASSDASPTTVSEGGGFAVLVFT